MFPVLQATLPARIAICVLPSVAVLPPDVAVSCSSDNSATCKSLVVSPLNTNSRDTDGPYKYWVPVLCQWFPGPGPQRHLLSVIRPPGSNSK